MNDKEKLVEYINGLQNCIASIPRLKNERLRNWLYSFVANQTELLEDIKIDFQPESEAQED